MANLEEVIRHEGNKWVLYSKDGKKKLGTFDTEAGARKREREVQFFKHRESNMAEEKIQVKEADIYRMTDAELKGLRKKLVGERTKLQTRHDELGMERYSTPAGKQLFADISYYDNLISRIECEMATRMLTL